MEVPLFVSLLLKLFLRLLHLNFANVIIVLSVLLNRILLYIKQLNRLL